MKSRVSAVAAALMCGVLAACGGNGASTSSSPPSLPPTLRDTCQNVNTAMAAIAYFSTGQSPPTGQQLNKVADDLEAMKATADPSSQALITRVVNGLRVLATTPPDQRATSAPGQEFTQAMDAFGMLCASVAAPLRTPSNPPSASKK